MATTQDFADGYYHAGFGPTDQAPTYRELGIDPASQEDVLAARRRDVQAIIADRLPEVLDAFPAAAAVDVDAARALTQNLSAALADAHHAGDARAAILATNKAGRRLRRLAR